MAVRCLITVQFANSKGLRSNVDKIRTVDGILLLTSPPFGANDTLK